MFEKLRFSLSDFSKLFQHTHNPFPLMSLNTLPDLPDLTILKLSLVMPRKRQLPQWPNCWKTQKTFIKGSKKDLSQDQ